MCRRHAIKDDNDVMSLDLRQRFFSEDRYDVELERPTDEISPFLFHQRLLKLRSIIGKGEIYRFAPTLSVGFCWIGALRDQNQEPLGFFSCRRRRPR
ncbi:MAG: hypothetical protein A2792_10200 [Sphingomonadales bacterium RIFCSPHIGHO2_01_FULL_65_20]|nr:MAG: hypothetical protein A2792_10200 [Sphingomonadales bacterium RIFCSPHIGHO2_01_FULL_65_20]